MSTITHTNKYSCVYTPDENDDHRFPCSIRPKKNKCKICSSIAEENKTVFSTDGKILFHPSFDTTEDIEQKLKDVMNFVRSFH